jgi:hypothetical protein
VLDSGSSAITPVPMNLSRLNTKIAVSPGSADFGTIQPIGFPLRTASSVAAHHDPRESEPHGRGLSFRRKLAGVAVHG